MRFFQAGAVSWSLLPSLRESQHRFWFFPKIFVFAKAKKGGEKFLKVLESPSPVGALLGFYLFYFIFVLMGRRECFFQAKERGWEDVSGAVNP